MKKKISSIGLAVTLAVALVAFLLPPGVSVATEGLLPLDSGVQSYAPGQEVVELRDQYSKTVVTETGYSRRINLGSIHYEDASGNFQPIDTTIVPSDKVNWDWEVETGHWKLLVNNDGTVLVKKGNNWIGTRFHGIAYLDITTKDYTILQTVNSVTPVVSGNSITWANILYGVDFVLYYTNDSLKEDIVVRQEVRDLLTSEGYRPSDYGYAASDTYLVMVTEVDWSQGLPMKLGIGTAINPDEAETDEAIYFEAAVEDRYFSTKLVSFLPVYSAISANPINPEDPEEEWEYANVVMKKRLVKKNDKHWLLTGVPVLTLNQMPEGSIIFDPTETLRPSGEGDETAIPYVIGAPSHWEAVDDISPDELTTYIENNSSTYRRDLYNVADHSVGSGTINNIIVYVRARLVGFGSGHYLKVSIKSGTGSGAPDTRRDGSQQTLTSSWVNYSQQWTNNPATIATWTWDEIDQLQIGLNFRSGTEAVRGTQVYVVIDYEEGVAEPDISNAPDNYAFGILYSSSTYSTGLDHFTITNNSGAVVSITISTSNWTGGIQWTVSNTATPGSMIVGIKAGLEGGSYNIIVKEAPAYNTLKAALADAATQKWGLQVETPTEYTDGVGKTSTITLTATLD